MPRASTMSLANSPRSAARSAWFTCKSWRRKWLANRCSPCNVTSSRSLRFQNQSRNLHRRFQRAQPVFASHERRTAFTHGLEERFDFRQQRIALVERLFLDRYLCRRLHRRRVLLADHGEDFLLHVDRQVGVVLEDADLAFLLEADAARCGVRDAAAMETQPRIDDVDLAG